MNEMDVLDYFYDELRLEGRTRETLFLSLDEAAVTKLTEKLNVEVQIENLHRLANICIANEWLERTTADPGYKYLSLTDAGLKMAVEYQYKQRSAG